MWGCAALIRLARASEATVWPMSIEKPTTSYSSQRIDRNMESRHFPAFSMIVM
jgi:hypothetical protein